MQTTLGQVVTVLGHAGVCPQSGLSAICIQISDSLRGGLACSVWWPGPRRACGHRGSCQHCSMEASLTILPRLPERLAPSRPWEYLPGGCQRGAHRRSTRCACSGSRKGSVGRRPVRHRSDRRNRSEVCTAHRFLGRPISASGQASPKLVGERRGEQGVARGVPPPGIFPADLDGRFPNHVLHRFRALTPAGSVISERRIRAAPSAAW